MANKIKFPVIDGMKECGECGEWKPIAEYRRARKHYTSRCIDCLKKYAAEYRQRPEVKVTSREYVIKYRSDPINREKLNARTREYRKGDRAKKVRNASRRAWTLKEKQKAVAYKGGKCEICGYDRCLAAMDFHHRNPEEKNGYGTGALKSHWTFEKNKEEIDKCILVCVRCHREIHAGVITI